MTTAVDIRQQRDTLPDISFGGNGDPEQTAVFVEIRGVRDGLETSWSAWFSVDHFGDRIVHVSLPDGWRAICRQLGLDDECCATEGYLETLARLEFARGER